MGFFIGRNLTKALIIKGFAIVAQFPLYTRHETTNHLAKQTRSTTMSANFHAADTKLIAAILKQFNFCGGNTPENEVIVTDYEDKINERDKDQYEFRILKTTRALWEKTGCDIEYSQHFWVKLTKTGKVKAKSLMRVK